MKISREQVTEDLKVLFSPDQVITDIHALHEHDGDNRLYQKACGDFGGPLPVCILNVNTTEEISKALKYCNENEVSVIPRTGMSSYEGLLTVVNENTIMLDASSMNQILKIDYENMYATCQCGVPLETLETILEAKGFTTGHAPQSQPVAQMGGLVATRSIGQFSTYYGGIEDLLCGLEAVLPDGRIVRIRNVPRRSAGPDLRHLFLGSEGALGVITEVTVKIFRYYPDTFWKGGYIVPNMEAGFRIIHDIVTAGYHPSVVRLYDKADFDYNYGSVELDEDEAFMFFVAEGPKEIARVPGEAVDSIAHAAGGRYIGHDGVDYWLIHRNDLCNTHRKPETRQKLLETRVCYATNEISANYTDIVKIYHSVIENVPKKIPELTLLGGHVSHAYQTGVNIYFVYCLKLGAPEDAAALHQRLIDALCEEVLKTETGGCVHHHGMGKQRVKFAPQEHGSSYCLMEDLKHMMDPKGIMNPGVLIVSEK